MSSARRRFGVGEVSALMGTYKCAQFFLIAGLLAACGEAQVEVKDDVDVNVSVNVMLSKSGIRVLQRSDPIVPSADVEESAGSLRYEFKSGDSVVASGRVDDPRVVHAEFDDTSNAEPHLMNSGAGSVALSLPDREGTLSVYDGDQLLGSQHITRFRELTLTQELMADADVVTQPTYFRGSAEAPIRILFLGDGYLASELGTFREDANKLMNGLMAIPEYARYANRISAQIAEVSSPNSGISDPTNHVYNKTAFEMRFGTEVRRCIWFAGSDMWWDTTSGGYQAALALRDRARANVVVIISNTREYAGCATLANQWGSPSLGIVSLSRDDRNVKTLAHELGHAAFGLIDEYSSGAPPEQCKLGTGGNMNISSTLAREKLPWADLVSASTPLPTPWRGPTSPSLIGAFEGGAHCAKNRWRSEHDCLMRSSDKPMCTVCRREMERRLTGTCDRLIDQQDGRGCKYTYEAALNGDTVAATNTAENFTGAITVKCNNGNWETPKVTKSCWADCYGSTGWTNALGCTYAWSATPSGERASAVNLTAGYTGTISGRCSKGKWVDVVDTCQKVP